MPDSPALRDLLKGQPLEAIARDRYGANWRVEMEATTNEAAVHCEAAHGPSWAEKFEALWQSEAGV